MNMADMNQQQPLNYMVKIWNRHIKNVEGLDMFVSTQPSP